MCFSAEASFTAGVLLTFVGAETLRKVHKPSQYVLASIPIFFAFQQYMEGILWLTIGHEGYLWLKTVSSYTFIAMAQVVWPIMIPVSVLLLEENKKRKMILTALLTVGMVIGLYYLYQIARNPVHAQIIEKHIVYRDTSQDISGMLTIFMYLSATIAPLFISTVKRAHVLGTIMGISFIVSAIFYLQCLTSVWCFFAAVMSFMVFYMVRDAHKTYHFNLNLVRSKIDTVEEP